MNHNFFYEEINRAIPDIPHVQSLRSLQYCAHYHEEVEILLVREGVIVLTVEGQELELRAGDIALVRPFLIHSLRTPEYSLIYLFKILCPLFDFSSVYRDRDDPVLHPASEEYAAASGICSASWRSPPSPRVILSSGWLSAPRPTAFWYIWPDCPTCVPWKRRPCSP